MNTSQFISELRLLRKVYKWEERPDGRILAKFGERNLCPITAVSVVRTAAWYRPGEYWKAARRIGLGDRTAETIQAASNGSSETKGNLRHRIAAALGVKRRVA